MWPFTSKPKRERGVVTLPGNWNTTTPAGSLVPRGHTGNEWGSLDESGTDVSPAAAESIAAVGAAICAISTTLAALPVAVVEANEQRNEVPSHDLMRLIRDGANPNETFPEFVETLVSTCLLHGNSAAQIVTDARGRLTALKTLPWVSMTVRVRDDDELLFDYRRPRPPGNTAQVQTLAREDILLLRDRSDDGLLGRPRLQRAGAAMAYAISIQSSAQTFSANISRPGGTLNSPGKVSEATANRLTQEWDENYNGRRRGKTAMLPEGLEFKPLTPLTAEDSQLVESRQWSVGDIARIFNVSPWLLGDSSRMTFASAKEATRSFATLTLAPWVARVEAAFQSTVLGSQYRLKFDLGALTKADFEAYSAALLRGRQGGWLSPNDARAELGWPSVPGADSLDPPVSGGQPAATSDEPSADPAPTEPPPADKIARLDQHRQRADHGNDD